MPFGRKVLFRFGCPVGPGDRQEFNVLPFGKGIQIEVPFRLRPRASDIRSRLHVQYFVLPESFDHQSHGYDVRF